MKNRIVYLIFLFLLLRAQFALSQSWVPLDKGIECFFNGDVRSIFVDTINDKLFIAGAFNQDGNCVPMRGIAQWDGIKWDSIGNTEGAAYKSGLFKFQDSLIVYGNWDNSNALFHLAKWDGGNWDSIPGGPNNAVLCYAEKNGELYMGGYFTHLGNDSSFLVGKYDGQQFSGLTPAHSSIFFGYVLHSMAFYKDTLYVAGNFRLPTGGATDLAKIYNNDYQVVDPQFLGTGALSYIETMAVFQGELYIGGYFRKQDGFTGDFIMKWDGTQFSEVGTGVNARVHAMEVHGNALYVAGDFDQASGIPTSYLAKWDGTQWYPFNMTFGNFPLIRDIAFFRDSLIISGNFPSIDGDTTLLNIAKYNQNLSSVDETSTSTISVEVFPNPTDGFVTFNGGNTIIKQIHVIDVFGRILIDDAIQGVKNHVINLTKFPDGMYIVCIQTDSGPICRRVLKTP